MGRLPRHAALLRVPPGRDRRQRARPRSGGALGLRLEPGAVRDLASGRLGAGRRVDSGGHRGRPQHGPRAASGLGAGEGTHRRPHAGGLVQPHYEIVPAAVSASGVSAPALPGPSGRRAHRVRQDGVRDRRRAHVDHRRRHRRGQFQEQDAHDRRGRARRHPAGDRRRAARLQGLDRLADRAAVLARRESAGAVRQAEVRPEAFGLREDDEGLPPRGGVDGAEGRAQAQRSRRADGGTAGESRRYRGSVPGHHAGLEIRPGADGLRGGGHGAGRRLRVHHALCARGGGAGELHRAGRGRRGPAPGGRRLQGAGAARGAGRQGRRDLSVPAAILSERSDGRCVARPPSRRAR